jgi:hypothetical protein
MKKKVSEANTDLLSQVESWLSLHQKKVIWMIMGAFTLMSLLLFNLRVSEGGDDSTYIIRALNFINSGSYPSFQGPLYPMFLSLFVGLFGINLGLLKMTSLILMLASIWVFYRIYRNRISFTLLFSTLLITCLSSQYIYFSSQTYSEALFILIQLPVFALVFRINEDTSGFINWKHLLLLSGAILPACLTRTVGVGALIAVLVFLILEKKYKHAAIVLGGFIAMMFVFLLIKSAVWDNGLFDGGQANTLLYKHPYQMDKGKETFSGFVARFIDNSNLYLSKHFLQMVGLKSLKLKSINGGLTILLYLLFFWGAFKAFIRNKYMLFTGIYTAVMLGITFVVLQKLWDQYRLIIPFLSGMILVLLYGIFEFAKEKKGNWLPRLAILLVVVCTISVIGQSFSKVDLMTLKKNLRGDLYEGYTDDWQHYLAMTEYVGKKLPADTYVAVRKPNMARIYANGKKFYGIYRFDSNDPDVLLKRLKDKKISHVIMASLRKNPAVNNGQTINTIHRYLYIISKKYPEIFKLEHKIGGEVEPAYLFKVDYKAAK